MIILFSLQLILPLILIALVGVMPPRSILGFWLQIIVTADLLLAVGMTGIWMVPPWWVPYAFGYLLLLASVAGFCKRRPFASVFPTALPGWALTVLYLGLGAAAVTHGNNALASRTPPTGELMDLVFPFDTGTYLVVNGGSNLSTNAHVKTLDSTVPRLHAWRGQSYGIDIVKIDGLGLRAYSVQPSEPNRYRIYGVDVIAPCAGEIVVATDGAPDMKVPKTDPTHMAGNHVILRCDGADVLLGHLKPGGFKIAVGARVAIGDHLAEVGNSGNTDEPHLHIHASDVEQWTNRCPVTLYLYSSVADSWCVMIVLKSPSERLRNDRLSEKATQICRSISIAAVLSSWIGIGLLRCGPIDTHRSAAWIQLD